MFVIASFFAFVVYIALPIGAVEAFVLAVLCWRRPVVMRSIVTTLLFLGVVFAATSYLAWAERLHVYPFS